MGVVNKQFVRLNGLPVCGPPLRVPTELGSTALVPGGPMEPLYPDIQVDLVGEDGNAFAIIGKVRQALRRGGVDDEVVKAFTEEATSGNYDNVVRTAMKYVEVL